MSADKHKAKDVERLPERAKDELPGPLDPPDRAPGESEQDRRACARVRFTDPDVFGGENR